MAELSVNNPNALIKVFEVPDFARGFYEELFE